MTIFGHSHYTQPWRIWTVNFTSLHQDCNQSSDYEMWKYAECNNNNVLGMNVAIRRRKENVECFNGETFKRTFENSSCSDCRLDVSSTFQIILCDFIETFRIIFVKKVGQFTKTIAASKILVHQPPILIGYQK